MPSHTAEPMTDAEMQKHLAAAPARFAFVLRAGPKFGAETQALQWEHGRNMFTLVRAGTLSSVTAFRDGTDVLGVGVLEAASKADVEALLRKDPAIEAGRFTFEVYTATSFVPGDF